MKRIFGSLIGFAMLFGLIATSVQSRMLSTYTSQAQAQPEAKSFTGTIVKSGEKFVLSDSATKSRYMLDSQDKARPYEGKRVEVTGTIDSSDLIHVETIQEIV